VQATRPDMKRKHIGKRPAESDTGAREAIWEFCSGKISPLSRESEYGLLCHFWSEDIDLK